MNLGIDEECSQVQDSIGNPAHLTGKIDSSVLISLTASITNIWSLGATSEINIYFFLQFLLCACRHLFSRQNRELFMLVTEAKLVFGLRHFCAASHHLNICILQLSYSSWYFLLLWTFDDLIIITTRPKDDLIALVVVFLSMRRGIITETSLRMKILFIP